MAFRDAYKTVGNLVAYCIEKNITLDEVELEEYKNLSNLFDEDIYEAIDLINCVESRNVIGGPSSEQVKKHIEEVKDFLKK